MTTPSWTDPTWPVNYKVNDFGADTDVINVRNAIAQSEKKLKKTMNANFGAKTAPVNPRNYVVPDFGIDRDILWTKGSIEQSEKVLNH